MSVLVCTLQGRFGNQVMQWLFAYAFALKYGMEFQCDDWIGGRVFALPEYKRPDCGAAKLDELPRVNELSIFSGEFSRWIEHGQILNERHLTPSVIFRGYAQRQECMIYTKRQAQAWLKLRPEIETACAHAVLSSLARSGAIVCHRRVGDYIGYGYTVVSHRSYERACSEFGLDLEQAVFLSEEHPISHAGHLPDDLAFMPDFYRMMTARTLLRANSSFSWLAALLGDGLVLSPIVDGLEGGKERDCAFVAGNWPRFCNLDFVSDLHVAP